MPLSPAQEIYCTERAAGATIKAAADTAGVAEKTGRRWDDDPTILARVDALQAPIRDDVLRIFRGKARRAAHRIAECIEPGYNLSNAAAINLRAAELTLKHAGFEPSEKKDVTVRGGVKLFGDTIMEDV